MTQFFTLAVRITGLILLIYGIHAVILNMFFYLNSQQGSNSWVGLSYALPVMMVALFFITFPLTVAQSVIPKFPQTNLTTIRQEHLEALACALIGLYFLVQACLDGLHLLTQYVYVYSQDQVLTWLYLQTTIANIVTAIAQLLIALWILLRGKGIFGLFLMVRNAGEQAVLRAGKPSLHDE